MDDTTECLSMHACMVQLTTLRSLFLWVWDILAFPKHMAPSFVLIQASLVAQLVKNPPAMRETWTQSLSWEVPLERGKTTHSSILA